MGIKVRIVHPDYHSQAKIEPTVEFSLARHGGLPDDSDIAFVRGRLLDTATDLLYPVKIDGRRKEIVVRMKAARELGFSVRYES